MRAAPRAPRAALFVELQPLRLAPVKIDQSASCKLHEFILALPLQILLNGSTDRLRPADVGLDTHQVVQERVINSDCRTHTISMICAYQHSVNVHIACRTAPRSSRR